MIKMIKLQNANLEILIALKLISWADFNLPTIVNFDVFYLFIIKVFQFVAL